MNGPYGLPEGGSYKPTFLRPGGYATLVSGSPVITTDQANKTIVYYAQDEHNAFPILKSGNMHAVYFEEPRLVLSTAHAANGIFDVFGLERNGKGHLVSGPNWTAGGGSVTAGSCARGTGGGSTELTRVGGIRVNRWGVAGLNDDGSTYLEPGAGTYLFSIFMDAVAGQITCHTTWGSSRKWGVWNAYNRRPLHLRAGDATSSWAYNSTTIRPSNSAATNSLTVFQGLLEEKYQLKFTQSVACATSPDMVLQGGIGWNSTTAFSGRLGRVYANGGTTTIGVGANLHAENIRVSSLGINVVTALEQVSDVGSSGATLFGTESHMVLSADWRG